MQKYKKVNYMEVLIKYFEIQSKLNSMGFWCDYLSIDFLANELKTSKYQIKKAYKILKEKEYIKLEKFPTSFEEYDNGLYCESIPILYSKAYILTDKGRKEIELWK